MKYKNPSKGKKIAKTFAIRYKQAQKVKNCVKNPLTGIIDVLIDKAAELDTSRKSYGMQKNRIQIHDPDTGKWAVINRKTNEVIRIHPNSGQPYKGIKKVNPYIKRYMARQCWSFTKSGKRCMNRTSHPSGLCYLHCGRVYNQRRKVRRKY